MAYLSISSFRSRFNFLANTDEFKIDMLCEIKLDLLLLRAMVYTDSIAKVYKVDRKVLLVIEGLSYFMKK